MIFEYNTVGEIVLALPSSLNLYRIVSRLSFAVLSSKKVGAESGSEMGPLDTYEFTGCSEVDEPTLKSWSLVLCIHNCAVMGVFSTA